LAPSQREARPREAVFADILRVAGEPSRSTEIIYRANLASGSFLTYMRFLQSRHLIERRKDKTWVTTDRGKEYLYIYSQLQKLLDYVDPGAPAYWHDF
jgi:predicted transcriptional regulator